jgi:RNA polymerase sigma-70 factor (ECF subfamily)
MLRNPQDAEDVCQAAFTKAWQQRDEEDRPANLGGWLRQVVVNECLQILRRKRIEKKGLTIRAAIDPQAFEATDAMDVHEEAMDALEVLEEPTRTVVVLRLMEGRSGNETATIMGYSPAEISRRLHDGLERMRTRLRRPVIYS